MFFLILIGSGKTAAFLIPMFERLKTHSAKVRHNQRNSRKLKSDFLFRRTDVNSDVKNGRKLSSIAYTCMHLYFKIKYYNSTPVGLKCEQYQTFFSSDKGGNKSLQI